MNTILAAIATSINGPSGKGSAARLASILGLLIVMLPWAWISVAKLELQPLTPEQIAVALGPAALKVLQKKHEAKP